jgi:hypothetical protein
MNLKSINAALRIQFPQQYSIFDKNSALRKPVPKQYREPVPTLDQRLRMQNLFFKANFDLNQIPLQTRHTHQQVYHAIQYLPPSRSKAYH